MTTSRVLVHRTAPPPHGLRPAAPGPRLVDEAGIRLGLAEGALVLAALGCAAAALGPTPSLVLLAVVTAGLGYAVPARWAALLGLSAWCFWTGFLDHALGTLTLRDGDLERLALLVLLAAVGSCVRAVHLRGSGGGRG